jgi:hypothetical protein
VKVTGLWKQMLFRWLDVIPRREAGFMQDEIDDLTSEIVWQNSVIEALKYNNRELTQAVNGTDLGTF